MSLYVLNAIQAPVNYTSQSTVAMVPILRVRLDVANQPIFWQSAYRVGSGTVWASDEHHMLPGSRVLTSPMGGIRVRAAVPMKGTVATQSALPTTGNKPYDIYLVQDVGRLFAWTGSAWTNIGPPAIVTVDCVTP